MRRALCRSGRREANPRGLGGAEDRHAGFEPRSRCGCLQAVKRTDETSEDARSAPQLTPAASTLRARRQAPGPLSFRSSGGEPARTRRSRGRHAGFEPRSRGGCLQAVKRTDETSEDARKRTAAHSRRLHGHARFALLASRCSERRRLRDLDGCLVRTLPGLVLRGGHDRVGASGRVVVIERALSCHYHAG